MLLINYRVRNKNTIGHKIATLSLFDNDRNNIPLSDYGTHFYNNFLFYQDFLLNHMDELNETKIRVY